jgi:hypothetical protein
MQCHVPTLTATCRLSLSLLPCHSFTHRPRRSIFVSHCASAPFSLATVSTSSRGPAPVRRSPASYWKRWWTLGPALRKIRLSGGWGCQPSAAHGGSVRWLAGSIRLGLSNRKHLDDHQKGKGKGEWAAHCWLGRRGPVWPRRDSILFLSLTRPFRLRTSSRSNLAGGVVTTRESDPIHLHWHVMQSRW